MRFIEARFTPGGELGLHLTAGVALMVLATAVFGAIAGAVVGRTGIALLDLRVSQWFDAHAAEPLVSVVLVFSALHSVASVAVAAGLLGWYFWRRRERYWLLALVCAVPGGMLLNVLLKYVYQRSRPVFDAPMVDLATYSFPSGHTSASTALYGFLACYVVMTARRHGTRVWAVLLAVLMVALVATSRVYLGAHYLSDVLAGIVESCGWLALCITGCSTLRRRRAA
ncbi:phosphatase PAP2 family protein [Rugamonas sp. CCM 8940]|uniref:phosphatase PAP2 family protein n=1 Tax=Rugamonas sp. CCM 8940 TaxID=2765359 RepID=UPI001F16DD58|nr:phosphatase PAP2 family protein [Rugamonas sp. CCM 8940]